MGIKIIAKNKKASYNYHLSDKHEAGMVLVGTEVKSLRAGKVNIAESYIQIDQKGEVWVHNLNIPHYDFGNINNHDETRKRKLLLNEKEIIKLEHGMKAGAMTIVPTMIYFRKNRVKLEIALAKGKQLHDKRQDLKKKDIEKKLRRGSYE